MINVLPKGESVKEVNALNTVQVRSGEPQNVIPANKRRSKFYARHRAGQIVSHGEHIHHGPRGEIGITQNEHRPGLRSIGYLWAVSSPRCGSASSACYGGLVRGHTLNFDDPRGQVIIQRRQELVAFRVIVLLGHVQSNGDQMIRTAVRIYSHYGCPVPQWK